MAERKGSDLRRLLFSAERFNDRATCLGFADANTFGSRSNALLLRVTSPDQYRLRDFLFTDYEAARQPRRLKN
jgi:hypothetical protein